MSKRHLLQYIILLIIITNIFSNELDVLEFTDGDFEIRIEEFDTALVFFYAPWCSHCTNLNPEFTKAAADLIRNDQPATLIKINCIESGRKTCDNYSITSYPTLKVFRNGKYYENYSGPRQAEDMIKYMKTHVRPVLKQIKSIIDLEKLLNSTKYPTVIGFFTTNSNFSQVFLEAARTSTSKCQFAYILKVNILNQQKMFDKVVIYRPLYLRNSFEETFLVYSGSSENVTEINVFISKHLHGLAGIRTLENLNDFGYPLIVAYFAIDYNYNFKQTNYWRNRILLVAKDFDEEVTFALSSSKEFAKELKKVEVDPTEIEKPVVIAFDSARRNYLFEEKDFSVIALTNFVINFLNNQLEPYIKSESIPETSSGPVIDVVGKNFEEMVLNNGKDTFIYLYIPWCDKCQELIATFEEAAQMLSKEDIVFTKINCAANELPSPYETGESDDYPILYWAPKGKKGSPVEFKGMAFVNDLIQFIAQRATNELNGWDRSGNVKRGKTEL